MTQVERTGNDFGSFTTTVLATTPANTPAPQFLPYLGDYMDMKSPGKDFCGIFSASNTPALANFPIGVTYQRNANFTTQTLFAADGVTPVPISIDPFFFELTELAAAQDVYVADWTDSADALRPGRRAVHGAGLLQPQRRLEPARERARRRSTATTAR